MRVWVERLRWLMLGGALLLVAVLAGLLGYGHWRALQLAREWQKRAGVTITHGANGVTYTQAIQGKTVFTLHAAKALQRPDGKLTLKDAELTLYSRTSPRVDQIYGSEFEWDQKEGVARAIGEVHMDLQAPESLTQTRPPQKIRGREGRAPSAGHAPEESKQTIHVRTSGLVYMRSLGIAATQQDVEFRYGSVEAHAQGAEFDEGESVVHLLGNVRIVGEKNGQSIDLHAARADLDRSNDLASLASPVAHAGGRTVSAASAVLHLRRDGSVQTVDADGGVQLTAGTQQLRGTRLHLELSGKTVPETATLDGAVTLVDTSATRPLRGQAQRMEASFEANGQPQVVTAIGGASLESRTWGPDHLPLMRTITGDRIAVTLAGAEDDASRRELREVHAFGHAQAHAESSLDAAAAKKNPAGRRTTVLAADDLRATFAATAEQPALQRVFANGHARMEQATTAGERRTTSADAMEIAFAAPGQKEAGGLEGGLEISSATSSGHVGIRLEKPAAKQPGPPSIATAAADRASFDGVAQRLTLTGGAQFRQNGVAMMANSIAADQRSGDATADGAVATTLLGSGAQAEPSHVMSEYAIFVHHAQVAQFFGTTGRPAKLWHGASQVQAADIRMDAGAKTLMARPAAGGVVTAVFVGKATQAGARGTAAPASAAARVVRVTSARMDYSDRTHEAVFAGGVAMNAGPGEVHAQRAVAFFAPRSTVAAAGGSALTSADPSSGSLQRVTASGEVRFAEPGRTGTGDQLLYTAATDEFVLTGGPASRPRVTDAQQGSLSGATMVFGAADQSVVVSGTPGQGRRGRVRTETTLGPP